MLWIILILISIIVLCVLWWYNGSLNVNPPDPLTSDIQPTMYARCHVDLTGSNSCGGDLICDLNCRRCKKRIGGNCATDSDCISGLHCHEWKCLPTSDISSDDISPKTGKLSDDIPPDIRKLSDDIWTGTYNTNHQIRKLSDPNIKAVKWDDDKTKTYYI